MTTFLSPIAKQVPGVRDPATHPHTTRKPWGYLLHTTGGGVTAAAVKRHKTPIAVAIQTYIDSQNGGNGYPWGGASYVIDHDGTIYQLAPDDVRIEHAGSSHRPTFLSGAWEGAAFCSPAVVAAWHKQWPAFSNPQALFPSQSPNTDYVGVEMIPVGDGFGGATKGPGIRFTQAQHDAAVKLGRDLAARHAFPPGWQHTSRLLGHEDVNPIDRHDNGGGWDPGSLRDHPWFDFAFVRAAI